MSLYPIFLKLEGHKVLIVGGGLIAEQKIEAVLRSATDVTVIAPQITARIQLWAGQRRLSTVRAWRRDISWSSLPPILRRPTVPFMMKHASPALSATRLTIPPIAT